mmetsp:Transcript_21536/g.30955  ORF Transcript_21536/g.30955 Transcript_21536/m.30955 type:complete len:453 (+) Transcript_21536:224-1582(+)
MMNTKTRFRVSIRVILGLSILLTRIKSSRCEDHRKLLGKRIIGGTVPLRQEFPWFASINIRRPYCAATLIHPDIIMTAAHCNRSINNWHVVVNAFTPGTDQGHIIADVHQRLPHPQFDQPSFYNNDVALIKLTQPVWDIPTITINQDPHFPPIATPVTILGMGDTTSDSHYQASDTLMKAQVTVDQYQTCNETYAKWRVPIIPQNMLCLGSQQDDVDSCRGDSGGPAIVQNDDGTFLQVGMVSFGYRCSVPGISGVYTRISGMAEWINQQLCSLSDFPPTSCKQELGTEAAPSNNTPSTRTPQPVLSPSEGIIINSTYTPSATPSLSTAPTVTSQPTYICDDDYVTKFFVDIPADDGDGDDDQPIGWKRCIWLQARPQMQALLCKPEHDAYHICEELCGKCTDPCEDSLQYFHFEGVLRNCHWLYLRPHKQDIGCVTSHPAFELCRETCENC